MKIPDHLKDLRTDRVGRPVPYINVWGDQESPERWRIGYDRIVRQVGAYYDDDFTGLPDFKHQCIQRQRQCMVLGLCQVCAREVPWSDRQVVLSSVSIEMIDLNGAAVAVVSEPWLCPDCADFATRMCPALIRRSGADDLLVVPVTDPRVCQLVISSGWIDGPYEMTTRRNPVAMWAKLMLPQSAVTGQRS